MSASSPLPPPGPDLTVSVAPRDAPPEAVPSLLDGPDGKGPVGLNIPGYELLREIGRGGMGVVYLARQVALNRLVALKVILSGGHGGQTELSRFKTEAEAIGRLQHPNIVQVYEVGQHEGWPYLALELCSGGSLATKLNGTPLPPREAALLLQTVARAVNAAHQAQVVHRDLSPGNVLLSAGGAPKLTDFGLARKLDEVAQTTSNAILGTPCYMAPEQAGGKNRQVGPPADVYALGAIFYECLTGRPPFKAATVMDTLLQVLGDEPVPVRQLQPRCPRDLDTICLKCIQKDARRRYASAADLAADLGRYLDGEPIHARPVGVAERTLKWVRRRPAVAGLLAGMVGLAVVAAVVVAWQYGVAVAQRNHALRQQEIAEEQTGIAEEKKAEALEQKRIAQESARKLKIALEETRQEVAAGMVRQAQMAAREEDGATVALERLHEVPADLRTWEWRYLRHSIAGGMFTIHAHTGPVASLAYSPDGQRLASAGSDAVVKIWDSRSGILLFTYRGHHRPVSCVAFSPDGQRVASGTGPAPSGGLMRNMAGGAERGEVKVWDGRTGAERFSKRLDGSVASVAFSPDGARLVAASGNQVTVWDARTGAELLAFKGHKDQGGRIASVTFSPDGRRLAGTMPAQFGPAKAPTTAVKAWDARTGAALFSQRLEGLGASAAFSPDGALLAGTTGAQVKAWDTRSQTERLSFKTATDRPFAVYAGLAFSPDGGRLATAQGQTVKVWDARTGAERFVLKGHTSAVEALAFHPDGGHLATGGTDGTVKVWAARTGPEPLALRGQRGGAFAVAISRDGQLIAGGGADGSVKVWDARSGAERQALPEHSDSVLGLAFSPDGALPACATGSIASRFAGQERRSGVKVWDVRTRALRYSLPGHSGGVLGVAFSTDGKLLATAGGDGKVRTWKARTGASLRTLEHGHAVTSVAFAPDGSLASSCYAIGGGRHSPMVRTWEPQTGAQRLALKGQTNSVARLAISPDGALLACAERGNTVSVWDARTGERKLTLKGHAGEVYSVAFSPDGQRLVSGSTDGTVKFWDVRTGAERLTLRAHALPVTGLVFSPDGARLMSAGGGPYTPDTRGELKVWDTHTQADRVFKGGVGSWPTMMAFSPEGRFLAYTNGDEVHVRDTHTEAAPRVLPRLRNFPRALAFSPDSKFLAACASDALGPRAKEKAQPAEVKVWHVSSGVERRSFPWHWGEPFAVAFSPDGKLLACLGSRSPYFDLSAPVEPAKGRLKVWDMQTGTERFSHVWTGGMTGELAFTSDSRLQATDGSGKAQVWDVRTGKRLPDLDDQPPARSPALRPDGKVLAHSFGSLIQLIDLRPPDAQEQDRRRWCARPDPLWHEEEASRHEKAGQWFAAAFHLDRVQPTRDDATLARRQGRARAELGQWPAAVRAFERAVRLAPDDAATGPLLALAQWKAGQPAAAVKTSRALVQRVKVRDALLAGALLGQRQEDGWGRLAALAPAFTRPEEQAQRSNAARCAVVLERRGVELLPWVEGGEADLHGAVLYRAARGREAAAKLGRPQTAFGLLFLGLEEHREGRFASAKKALEQARDKLPGLPWEQRVEAEVLIRELEGKLP